MNTATIVGIIIAVAIIAFIVYKVRGAGGTQPGTRRDDDGSSQQR